MLRQLKNSKCRIIRHILQRGLAKSEKMLTFIFKFMADANVIN